MSQLLLLSTRSMKEYTAAVARHISRLAPYLEADGIQGQISVERFADGEMEVSCQSSVRGRDVFLFANCSRNPLRLSVEECKLELYQAVDAIRRAKARSLTVFEPYMSCSRSDRITRRNSVGLWTHFKILASLGVQSILTYQLHSDKSKSMLDPSLCSIDDLPATLLLKQRLCDGYIGNLNALESQVRKDWVFCCVDSGGEKLAKGFADAFGAQLVIAHKQRNYAALNTVDSVSILSSSPIAGKTVWIVDDMIDTGGSVYTLVQELGKREVAAVNIATVHPVFSEPALARMRSLHEQGLLGQVLVSDTIPLSPSMQAELPGLSVVSSTELSARVILSADENKSFSAFFECFDAERYLNGSEFLF